VKKKHIILPLILLIYLAIMAYHTYPGHKPESEGISFSRYYITLGVEFIIIVALSFFLKKKNDNKNKYKDKN
jgi:hypothetical protein